MVEVRLFHYTDRGTYLHRAHPITKLFALFIFSLIISGTSLPGVLSLLILFSLVSWTIRFPISRYTRELRFFLFMALIIGTARAVGGSKIETVVLVMLRFVIIVQMGMLFTDTSAPDDIARAIGSMLSRLPSVPGYRIGATIELTLASIPMLFDVALEVSQARKARGENRRKHPLRRIVSYGTSVFELMLDRAQQMEAALTARGYREDAVRSHLSWSLVDLNVSLGIMLVASIIVLCC